MNVHVELAEWDRAVVRVPPPPPADLDVCAGLGDGPPTLDLRWLRNGRLEIRSSSWVGVVRLSGVQIDVRPKYAGGALGVIRMVEYAGGFRTLRTLPARRSLPAGGADLLDVVGALLADEADALVLDGLLRDYRTEESALPTLRGSLRYREQATRRYGRLDQLECRFDDLHADVLENQLLRAGLTIAQRICRHDGTRRRLRRVDHALAGLVSVGPHDVDFYRRSLVYGRRNERYRAAHELALLLLDQVGVDDLYGAGPLDSFAFLVDMNVLFETFMARLVAEALTGTRWRVTAQRRYGSVIRRTTGQPYASIVPDLVLSDGHHQVPFDCKYKLYGLDRKISTADVYQSFLYAQSLSAGDVSPARAGVIYPAATTGLAPELTISRVDGRAMAGVTGVAIDLLGVQQACDDPVAWPEALARVRAALDAVLEPAAA